MVVVIFNALSDMGEYMRLIFSVSMHCKGCENTIKNSIFELNGVKSVKADYTENKLIVEFDESKIEKEKITKEIKKKIQEEGYGIKEVGEQPENKRHGNKSIMDIFKVIKRN